MDHDPEQVFYKLAELSELLGVENSVLRFWEKEFPQIKPMKVGPRKRLYRRKDLETFQEIKSLLYEDRFTIAGAKKRLSQGDTRQRGLFEDDDKLGAPPLIEDEVPASDQLKSARALLDETRRGLLEIRDLLLSRRPDQPAEKPAAKPAKAVTRPARAGKAAPAAPKPRKKKTE